MKIVISLLVLSTFIVSCSSNKPKELSPRDKRANIYYGQGTRNLVDKEYTKALKNLLEANSLRSNDTKIHTNLGMAYYFKKNEKLAIKHLNYAIELDGKNTDARLNLATVLMNQGKYNEAEAQYQMILKDLVYEKQFRTYYNLGILELKRNNIPKAVEYFNSSINVEENYCPSFFQLGKVHFKQANYKKAMKMFVEASMGTCYENPEPHYMQAMTLVKLKRYGDATLKLEEMIEKFALTKFESIAQRALVRVNELKKKRYNDQMNAKNYDRNILTPDF